MSFQQLGFAAQFNFLWKRVARTLASTCQRCGHTRLESVFDAYRERQQPGCRGCATAYHLTRPLIHHVFNDTTFTEREVQTLLADPLIRRSTLNVVRGIRHFGLQSPQPTAVPVVIVWNYTNRCNLQCLHCHQSSGEAGDRELTTADALKVVDALGAAGLSILTFSGGEPLLRSDLYAAIARATDGGLYCTIASNGTGLTQPVVHKLKRAGVHRVEVGLDGCRAETHDFLRNAPGAFDATLQGLRNCVAAGFDEVCATMTLHTKNVDELQGTIDLAEDLGVDRFYLNRLIPAGRGRDVIDLDVSRAQKINALESIYRKFHDSAVTGEGIQCYSRGMTYYGRLGYERSDGAVFTVSEALSGYSRMWRAKFGRGISALVRRYAPGFGGCSAGITYAGLTAGGDLIPCVPASHIPLGNLLHEALEDLWVNNEVLRHLRRRDALTGACGRCHFNAICGGCRYTAYVVHGDWLAADPSCPFGPSLK